MSRLLVDLTIALTALNLGVTVTLAVRRLVVARREARMEEAEERLRPVVLAMVDGEDVELPYLDSASTLALSRLLRRYGRLLRGTSRDHIARVAERSGLVERELGSLADRRDWRRAAAAVVLGDVGRSEHADALARLLTDRSQHVRNAAVRSLGRLGAVDAIPRIARLMAIGRIPRALAAETLRAMGSPAAGPLVDLLDAREAAVRAAAAELVGLVGDGTSAEPLMRLLEDPDPEVRVKAARALGRVGAEDAVLELRDALHDPVPFVRAVAARTLGSIGDDGAMERLMEMAVDDVHDPARAAAGALASLNPELVASTVAGGEPPPYLAEALDLERL